MYSNFNNKLKIGDLTFPAHVRTVRLKGPLDQFQIKSRGDITDTVQAQRCVVVGY